MNYKTKIYILLGKLTGMILNYYLLHEFKRKYEYNRINYIRMFIMIGKYPAVWTCSLMPQSPSNSFDQAEILPRTVNSALAPVNGTTHLY